MEASPLSELWIAISRTPLIRAAYLSFFAALVFKLCVCICMFGAKPFVPAALTLYGMSLAVSFVCGLLQTRKDSHEYDNDRGRLQLGDES